MEELPSSLYNKGQPTKAQNCPMIYHKTTSQLTTEQGLEARLRVPLHCLETPLKGMAGMFVWQCVPRALDELCQTAAEWICTPPVTRKAPR